MVSGCVFVVAHVGSTVELCGDQPVPGVEVWQGNLDTVVAVPLCAKHRAFSGRHVVPARVAAAATLQLPLLGEE